MPPPLCGFTIFENLNPGLPNRALNSAWVMLAALAAVRKNLNFCPVERFWYLQSAMVPWYKENY